MIDNENVTMNSIIVGVRAMAAHIGRSHSMVAKKLLPLMLELGEATRHTGAIVFDATAADRWRDYLAWAGNRGGAGRKLSACRYQEWCKSRNLSTIP